jgi:peptidoglycan/xylan/chitin deacetylase (PgdA/CDA1 family)
MRPFLVCIHDATPAYARETRVMLGELAPLLGRRLSLGVVPNWHGQWHLTAYPDYCRLIAQSSEELLLHGYFHRRDRGWGPVTWLAEGSDEMNGLDADGTRGAIERGQRVFTEVFARPARGFLAPAWQAGRLRTLGARSLGLGHVVGFLGIESEGRPAVPLATWTWDCGRWGWMGHVGHGLGRILHALGRGVPMLAIHPRDLERGYWPTILVLIRELLAAGYEPSTVAHLVDGSLPGERVSAALARMDRMNSNGNPVILSEAKDPWDVATGALGTDAKDPSLRSG